MYVNVWGNPVLIRTSIGIHVIVGSSTGQVDVVITMDHQFPSVVQLNVGGTYCQHLLKTLTAEDDSDLAAMFTGRKEVFKDNDDRYFIDSDWNIFKYILEYLQNRSDVNFVRDLLSSDTSQSSETFFSSPRASFIVRLHREAKRFGINSLVKVLERHQSVYTEMKIKGFQMKIPDFELTTDKILSFLSGDVLMDYDTVIIKFCQEMKGEIILPCKHNCQDRLPDSVTGVLTNSGQRYKEEKIVTRQKMSPPALMCIGTDLTMRGYSVRGHIEQCHHECRVPFGHAEGISATKMSCQKIISFLQISWDDKCTINVLDRNGTSECCIQQQGQDQQAHEQQRQQQQKQAEQQNQEQQQQHKPGLLEQLSK